MNFCVTIEYFTCALDRLLRPDTKQGISTFMVGFLPPDFAQPSTFQTYITPSPATMVIAAYKHNSDDSPIRSPRTACWSSISTPDYRMFLHDLDDQASDKGMSGFQVLHRSANAADLSDLAVSKILLLLTPVMLPEISANTKPDKERQDPFEAFGRKLSKKHRRIRHVPYLATVGLTSTHEAFLREAGAVIYVTVHGSASKRSPTSSQHRKDWEGLTKPYVLLRYSQDAQGGRADSPHEEMNESVGPTDQQIDDVVKSLFSPTKL